MRGGGCRKIDFTQHHNGCIASLGTKLEQEGVVVEGVGRASDCNPKSTHFSPPPSLERKNGGGVCEAQRSEGYGESDPTDDHFLTEDHNKRIVSLGTRAEGGGVAGAWAEGVTETRIKHGLSLLSLARDGAWWKRVRSARRRGVRMAATSLFPGREFGCFVALFGGGGRV